MISAASRATSIGRSRVLAIALTGMVATLAGCASKDQMTTSSINDDYRSRHPIVLTQAEHTVDIPVSSGDRRLTVGMRDTVRGFVQDYKQHATGTVEILTPQGAMNGPATSNLRRDIRQELVASGIASPRIVDSFYPAGGAGDAAPIRLSFMATTAVTNACGQWPEDLGDRPFDNQNYYNFGCAQQSNLAAQIANPTDLVAPRAQTPIDATQRAAIIGTYRSGANSASTSLGAGTGG